jgi:DNA-binding transcriptional MocR family regulator
MCERLIPEALEDPVQLWIYLPVQFIVDDAMTITPRVTNQPPKTLVDESIEWVMQRIQRQVFAPGTRLPSIRALARQKGVSPFTISEAYARLVAVGILEARKGSGYYAGRQPTRTHSTARQTGKIDLSWLLHHMLSGSGARGPGLGVLPSEWFHGIEIGIALRSLGRQGRWLDSGRPSGFEPLRALIQRRLSDLDILAETDQIILTTGITHALNLALRVLVKPGDTVLTLDPCWFGALGMLSGHGARIVGVPFGATGLDFDFLERTLIAEHPRLLILSSIGHNPTGLSLPLESVKRILNFAAKYDFWVFEDDVYADLSTTTVRRLAAEAGLSRVIYANSFSKTLASNIRVGFMACEAPIAQRLAEAKLLGGFTTPELNERLVHKLLVEGHYARHVTRLRKRLTMHRARMRRFLTAEGVEVLGESGDGLFLWVNMHTDTTELAQSCSTHGLLLAPGGLFSPRQDPSSWMRINVTTSLDDIKATLANRRRVDRAPR